MLQELSGSEIERYARQIILPQIGQTGQANLRNARVLIVGLGGLGCPAAQYLTAMGVGHLGLVDPDVVEGSNLHRQILYFESDIGRSKVTVAQERLQELNRHTAFELYRESFNPENADRIAADYPVVLDCTDNYPARYAINDYCMPRDKIVIFASLYRFEGMLAVFDGLEGGCYRCLYPQTGENYANCAEAGVLGVLPGILGTMQALEAVKTIVKAGSSLAKHILYFDGLLLQTRRIARSRNPACRTCSAAKNKENLPLNSPRRVY